MVLGFLLCPGTVSYTHLDVYKRQRTHRFALDRQFRTFGHNIVPAHSYFTVYTLKVGRNVRRRAGHRIPERRAGVVDIPLGPVPQFHVELDGFGKRNSVQSTQACIGRIGGGIASLSAWLGDERMVGERFGTAPCVSVVIFGSGAYVRRECF